jgi:hypothetical protein
MLKKIVEKFPPLARLRKIFLRYWKPIRIGKYYLEPLGYFNEHISDSNGNAIPWFTYPSIIFLESIIQKQWKVFEYGSGYSTVFWNRKCQKTVSVEHDENWFSILRQRNRDFEIYLLKEGADRSKKEIVDLIVSFEAKKFDLPLSPDQVHNNERRLLNIEFANYAAKIIDFPKGYFDVIVVDGVARCLCLFLAVEYISESGIIILDNSDRWQYNDLQKYLIQEKGFQRLDFHGLSPMVTIGTTTSIFFKNTDFLIETKIMRDKGAGDLGW